jgi:hypothetical protein
MGELLRRPNGAWTGSRAEDGNRYGRAAFLSRRYGVPLARLEGLARGGQLRGIQLPTGKTDRLVWWIDKDQLAALLGPLPKPDRAMGRTGGE